MPVPVVEALETVYRRETSYKHLSAFGQCRNAEDQARIVGLSQESAYDGSYQRAAQERNKGAGENQE